jgi:[methyl-Co(III) methanol-specific corrinoid protein]:coenzyme M methyltransferase
MLVDGMSLGQKERLLRTLEGLSVDRPPVICPGGMMNAAIVEIMEKRGHTLPGAHTDEDLMVSLAVDVHQETGFENFGLPFCMTVEAEALGSSVSLGSLSCEPKIEKEAYRSVSEVEFHDLPAVLDAGRIPVVLKAVRTLAAQHPDVPVIATLTGPISLCTSLVDPMTFYRELRTKAQRSREVVAYASRFLELFAEKLVENGASCITIADPSATGEVLGPNLFGEYAVKYINRIADGIRSATVPAILHICGDMGSTKHLLPGLHVDAISTDAMVSLRALKKEMPDFVTMGNVSTFLLESGDPERVRTVVARLVNDGIDIIAPACGLATSTPLEHIRAMTGTVKTVRSD